MSGYRPPVAPVPPPSRSLVFVVGSMVGIGGGLVLAALWLPPDRAPLPVPVVVPSQAPDVYELTLVMPTPNPTPTWPPTVTAIATTSVDICGQATPGAICRMPFAPAPTPTAYPSCLSSPEAGDLCAWPRVTPAPERFTP